MANFTDLDAIFDRILIELDRPEGSSEISPFENLKVTEELPRFRSLLPITVKAAKDGLSASVYVAAPAKPNNRFSVAQLREEIKKKGIAAGIDDRLLAEMAEDQLYNTEIVFARGRPAVNGRDGSVRVLLEPEADVNEGDEICRIIPAEKGTDGFDVYGNTLYAVNGRAPDIPQGYNTSLNRERTALLAAATGKLKLNDGFYAVRNEHIVEGDVYRTVKPLTFAGDIIVTGNINEGAVVNAGGSVQVAGMVKKATVTGKQITIDGAVISSYLTARGGGVSAESISGSTIEAEGDVETTSIANSKVSCTGKVLCLTNPGRIAGGLIRSIGGIACLVAGNYMRDPTELVIGDCFEYTEEKRALEKRIASIDAQIERLTIREDALKSAQKAHGGLSQEDADFLKTAAKVRVQQIVEKDPLKLRLDRVEEIIASATDPSLEVGVALHTNVTVTIGTQSRIIASEYGRSVLTANEFGIVIT
ncbi:MAG: FapA family protein [Bacteroides sp.]|nr:FapA family protein [Eubacterium sp.]MCM1418409.1 FapA family protein [Roseburia sp.]MCM1461569.1 FapA family protein [Bacteroides sp.]